MTANHCKGGPTYWMPRFDFQQFLDYCDRYKITFFFTVPPIYLLIAKSPAVTNQFRYLEYAISGAAPMGKELQEAASAKFKNGQTFISQTWGLSENTGSATLNNFGEVDLSGSVSRLLPNMKLRYAIFPAPSTCRTAGIHVYPPHVAVLSTPFRVLHFPSSALTF